MCQYPNVFQLCQLVKVGSRFEVGPGRVLLARLEVIGVAHGQGVDVWWWWGCWWRHWEQKGAGLLRRRCLGCAEEVIHDFCRLRLSFRRHVRKKPLILKCIEVIFSYVWDYPRYLKGPRYYRSRYSQLKSLFLAAKELIPSMTKNTFSIWRDEMWLWVSNVCFTIAKVTGLQCVSLLFQSFLFED